MKVLETKIDWKKVTITLVDGVLINSNEPKNEKNPKSILNLDMSKLFSLLDGSLLPDVRINPIT